MDAFEPPSADPGPGELTGAAILRRAVGGTLVLVGGFLGLWTLVALLVDVLALSAGNPGGITGVFTHVVCLGMPAVFFVSTGLAIASPERFGTEVIARDELADVYRERGLADRPEGPAGHFAGHSASDLIDALHHLDRDSYPERWEQLLSAIKAHVEGKQSG